MKILLIILISVASLYSQPQATKCDLSLDQSPSIRGLKLGMTEKDAVKVVPDNFKIDLLEPMIRTVDFVPSKTDANFENINYVSLGFYDNALIRIRITYNERWNSTREFVENFSPKLGLPMNAWVADKYLRDYPTMPCRDFSVGLSTTQFSSSLFITDTTAVQKINEQNSKADAARKRDLKP